MTKKINVLAFCGLIGSGKDTAADYLVNVHGYRRDSFANTLKDAVASIFGWDRVLLEGRTTEARAWREKVDAWWATRLNIPHLTPRWVLQHWGTDVCRVGFHDDIWIASLEYKIQKTQDNIVISDVRFPNEIAAIHRAGGTVIQVKRGPDPTWIPHAIAYNKGPNNNPEWAIGKEQLDRCKIHASEYSWVGGKIDYVIENNSTVDSLFSQIQNRL